MKNLGTILAFLAYGGGGMVGLVNFVQKARSSWDYRFDSIDAMLFVLLAIAAIHAHLLTRANHDPR